MTPIALGPDTGQLRLRTGRQGMAAKAGHDLTIEAQTWSGQAEVHLDAPTSSSVAVEVAVDGLTVLSGTGGVKPLSDSDKQDIQRNIQRKILHADKHPTIRFTSIAVTGTPESFEVAGELTIGDTTAPLTLTGTVSDGRARGTATVTQTRWGIKPFTAFLGALKLADDVTVEFDMALR
ncbi:MAG: YceI family protein [Thermocrispum sp.]